MECLDRDIAIRRFCPARIEEELGDRWEEIFRDIELCSHADTTISSSEIDDLVESFINDYDHIAEEPRTDCLYDKSMSTVDQGLHLVHTLLACAEAVDRRDSKLAESLLVQIRASVSPLGDPLQRVCHWFAAGLESRLSMLPQNTSPNSSSSSSDSERAEAFPLLYQVTPFVEFGFTVANEAISQKSTGKDCIHIIDLGTESTLQWSPLMRTLASRPEGPPRSLRITALIGDQPPPPGTEELVGEAISLGIPLDLRSIPGPITPSILTRENLGLRKDESVFVNTFARLHELSGGSPAAILAAVRNLSPSPVVLTVAEQDADHNGAFFLGRFAESLHYYSAVFDSLELSLPRESSERARLEKFRFGSEIRNILGFEGSARIERHERADRWRSHLGWAGFRPAFNGLEFLAQTRVLLCDERDYTLAVEKGCVLLGWRGRSLFFASAWESVPTQNLSSS